MSPIPLLKTGQGNRPVFELGLSYNKGRRRFYYFQPLNEKAHLILNESRRRSDVAPDPRASLEELPHKQTSRYLSLFTKMSLEEYGENPKIIMKRGVSADTKTHFRALVYEKI